MIGGIIESKIVNPQDVIASDGYMPSLEGTKAKYGIKITQDNKEFASSSDVVFLL